MDFIEWLWITYSLESYLFILQIRLGFRFLVCRIPTAVKTLKQSAIVVCTCVLQRIYFVNRPQRLECEIQTETVNNWKCGDFSVLNGSATVRTEYFRPQSIFAYR